MKKRVLLVDDDKDLVGSFKVVLEANGFDVVTAHNGTDALAQMAAEKPRRDRPRRHDGHRYRGLHTWPTSWKAIPPPAAFPSCF
jgi:CheY-like chemotaxis protein